MVIYFYRERADNENALSDVVITPTGPRGNSTCVEELDRLKSALAGNFDHALDHPNADAHDMFNGAVIAPAMPVARPFLTPGLVSI